VIGGSRSDEVGLADFAKQAFRADPLGRSIATAARAAARRQSCWASASSSGRCRPVPNKASTSKAAGAASAKSSTGPCQSARAAAAVGVFGAPSAATRTSAPASARQRATT
jgi:hypothetical protein